MNSRTIDTPSKEGNSHLFSVWLFFTLLTWCSLAGCKRENEQSPINVIPQKVENNKIIVAANSSLRNSFAVENVKALEKSVIHFTGELTWDESQTVRVYSSVAGRVNMIFARPGQKVTKGDTLANLDSPDFDQAQSDARKAEADMKLSSRTFDRLHDLFKHGAAAQKDLDAAEDDFDSKKAERQRALSRLRILGVEPGSADGQSPLKTPISGIVVERNMNPGQQVRSDFQLANDSKFFAPLFIVSDPLQLAVTLDVTELDINELKPEQELQVTSRAYPGKVFRGRLEFIGNSLDPQTRTVKARGLVDNSEGLLKAEMYVQVDVIKIKDTDNTRLGSGTVEIPVTAVFTKENEHYVFIEKNHGEYERNAVTLGMEHDGKVEIKGGLALGQSVVTRGCLQLQAVAEASKGN